MDRKKEIANTGQGNRVGDMGKSADEASALTVYHETMKKTRRRKTPDVRVFHPSYGSVVVPGGSKLIAIQNAARIWGVPYSSVNSAEVWYLPPEERDLNALSGRLCGGQLPQRGEQSKGGKPWNG